MRKIRVLHLTTHLNVGGITTYIFLLAKKMNQSEFELFVASSGGNSTPKFQAENIRTFEFPFRTKSELSPKIYLNLPRAIQLIKEEKIDLLHAHTRVTQVLAWWIKQLTGTPYVSTCHGFYKRRLGRKLLPAWGEAVVAISEPVSDLLKGPFRVPSGRVRTIYNAIDIEDLEKRAAEKSPEEIKTKWRLISKVPVLGVIARLVADKGHEYLVRALDSLRHRYPDIKLLIVGEGPFESSIKKLVNSLKLENSVRFIGNLHDVTEALSVIDIFVLPAVWREGFGLSIVEAMALKKPVIVTDIWALNTLVQNRVNGLLIEPRNVDVLCETAAELIENESFRNQVAENAYQTACRQFSIDRMVREMAKFYQNVLERSYEKSKPLLTVPPSQV